MADQYYLRMAHLSVRRAKAEDAVFIHELWTSSGVMHFIGFPKGLAITIGDVRRQIESGPDSEFGSLLIAELLETGLPMGQCKIGAPDEEGICEPDIKLKPEYWGNGYSKELWAALIDYAFTHSSAVIVQGTPNRTNTASVRMQQSAGMVEVEEGVFEPDLILHPDAIPVPYSKFQITREQWKSRCEMESDKDGKGAA